VAALPDSARHLIVGAGVHGRSFEDLGKELGARSEDPSHHRDGRVDYGLLATSPHFLSGIDRLDAGARRFRLAVMCAEKEPLDCHRTLLIARVLVKKGWSVKHILADGKIEPYAESMTRLLQMVGLPETDMFRSHEELIEEACALQEEKIAYTDEDRQPAVAETQP